MRFDLKQILEMLAETSAAAAAFLWFVSARIRLKRQNVRRDLGSGLKTPRALLHMIYHQSQWSAWAAVAAGMAALFALADGFVR